eukprot:PITA_14831
MGKFAKSHFPSSDSRATRFLDLIHTDVSGQMSHVSLSGYEYYVLFIDDHSRKTWIYFLKTKSEVFKRFQEFKALVETQIGRKIKVLRPDNGGEYTLGEFVDFCAKAGIRREFIVPYDPQQNGVAERKNRSITGDAKAMLHDQGLPLILWAEACNIVVYLQNRSPHHALGNVTSEEAFFGKKPNVGHFRIFGCLTYSYVPKEKRTKLDLTTDKGIFVGYSETSKTYRIYIPAQRKVVVRQDVKFEEERAFKRSRELRYEESPNPQDKLSQSQGSSRQGSRGTSITMSGPSVSSGSQIQVDGTSGNMQGSPHSSSRGSPLMDSSHGTSASTGTDSGMRSIGKPSGVQASNDDRDSFTPVGEVCSGKRKHKWLQDTLREATSVARPKRRVRESKPPKQFCSYMAMVTSIVDSRPSSYEEVASQQVGKEAMMEEYSSIIKNDVWEVVPRLEGKSVVTSRWLYKIKHATDGSIEKFKARFVVRGFSQVEGDDYEETFAPVARYTSIRSIIWIAAEMGWKIHQMDVKTAFLDGFIQEEVYIEQPQGFEQLGFTKSEADLNLYFIVVGEEPLILVLYVDDLIITGAERLIEGYKRDLDLEFEMKDITLMHYFLGLEVWQEEGYFFLGQWKYIVDILNTFHMEDCKPMSTPMITNWKKLHASNSELVDSTLYEQLIGCSMYLVNTQPNLCFAVNSMSQFMCEPKRVHWVDAKHILPYLQRTVDFGLDYRQGDGVRLARYTNSDWASCVSNRKSTSGCCFGLGSAIVSWISRKQQSVALSSAEAEYMAASLASCEAIWLRKMLFGLFGQALRSNVALIVIGIISARGKNRKKS